MLPISSISVPIPPRPLARLRAAWATYQSSRVHFEDMLNAVAETLGINTDLPGVQAQLDQGVILVPQSEEAEEVASATAGRLGNHDR